MNLSLRAGCLGLRKSIRRAARDVRAVGASQRRGRFEKYRSGAAAAAQFTSGGSR